MRWAGHVARKDDMKSTYKVSVIKSNATLSANSAAVWQYEVLFVVRIYYSYIRIQLSNKMQQLYLALLKYHSTCFGHSPRPSSGVH
jgi:hypothetical protein